MAEIVRGGADKVRGERVRWWRAGTPRPIPSPSSGWPRPGSSTPIACSRRVGGAAGGRLPPDQAHRNRPDHHRRHARPGVCRRAQTAIASMSRLNHDAARLRSNCRRARCTPSPTSPGFGLGGHAHEMAMQSGLAVRFDWAAVPLLPRADRYARRGSPSAGPGGTSAITARTCARGGPAGVGERLLFDPQTSGGLLAAVGAEHVPALLQLFDQESIPPGASAWPRRARPGSCGYDARLGRTAWIRCTRPAGEADRRRLHARPVRPRPADQLRAHPPLDPALRGRAAHGAGRGRGRPLRAGTGSPCPPAAPATARASWPSARAASCWRCSRSRDPARGPGGAHGGRGGRGRLARPRALPEEVLAGAAGADEQPGGHDRGNAVHRRHRCRVLRYGSQGTTSSRWTWSPAPAPRHLQSRGEHRPLLVHDRGTGAGGDHRARAPEAAADEGHDAHLLPALRRRPPLPRGCQAGDGRRGVGSPGSWSSPSVQGTKPVEGRRQVFARWFFRSISRWSSIREICPTIARCSRP